MVGQWNRLALVQVVEHHNRQATAFHLLRVGVDDILLQVETRAPNVRDARASGDMAASLHLREEIGLDVHHDNGLVLPIHIGADGRKILRFRRVVKLEKHAVVHVSERVHVVPTNLQRQRVMEFLRLRSALYVCRLSHIIPKIQIFCS